MGWVIIFSGVLVFFRGYLKMWVGVFDFGFLIVLMIGGFYLKEGC